MGRETDKEQDCTWELYSVALITIQLTHGYIRCSNGDEIRVPVFYVCICVCVYVCIYIYVCVCVCVCGPGSLVGITTDYGLDGPGSNAGGDDILRPSRPFLGPTQRPVKWVPGLSRG